MTHKLLKAKKEIKKSKTLLNFIQNITSNKKNNIS